MSHLKQTNKQQTWTKAATRQHLGVCVLARAARSCAGETRSFLGMLRGLLLTLVSTFYSPLVYSLFSCVWFFFRKHIITASKSTYLGKMVISVVWFSWFLCWKLLWCAVKPWVGTRHLGVLVWYLANCCWSEVCLLLQLCENTSSHSGTVSL